MNFVPSAVKAEEWGISQRRVAILCKEHRIPGAKLIANRWFYRLIQLSQRIQEKKGKILNNMTVGEFREYVCRTLVVELESYHTQESIKKCRFTELTDEDLKLKINTIWPVLEGPDQHKLWDTAFKIVVYQD